MIRQTSSNGLTVTSAFNAAGQVTKLANLLGSATYSVFAGDGYGNGSIR